MLADPTGAFTAVRFVFDIPTILVNNASDRKSYGNPDANGVSPLLSEPWAVVCRPCFLF